MKKNGFISISIMYSFFLVFMLLLVLIMTTYINNRINYTVVKNDLKSAYGDIIIPSQVTTLENYCNDIKDINYKDKVNYLSCKIYNDNKDKLVATSSDGSHLAYRFVGSDNGVNNYYCFGANSNCARDDENLLYRVVGIFQGYYLGLTNNNYYIKLIKNSIYSSAGAANNVPTTTNLGLDTYASSILPLTSWKYSNISSNFNRENIWTAETPTSGGSIPTNRYVLNAFMSDILYADNTFSDHDIINNIKTSSKNNWLMKSINNNYWIMLNHNTNYLNLSLENNFYTGYMDNIDLTISRYYRPTMFLKVDMNVSSIANPSLTYGFVNQAYISQ